MTMTQQKPLITRTETRSVSVSVIVVDHYPRCIHCEHHPILVGMATRPWRQQCRSCRTMNYGETQTV